MATFNAAACNKLLQQQAPAQDMFLMHKSGIVVRSGGGGTAAAANVPEKKEEYGKILKSRRQFFILKSMSLYKQHSSRGQGKAAPSIPPVTSSADVTALSSNGMACMQYDPHTNTPPTPCCDHSGFSSCTDGMLHSGL